MSEDLFYLYKQCRPWWNAALCIMLHFIWVFSVCKSTRLGVSRIQRIIVIWPGENPVSWLAQFVFINLYVYLETGLNRSHENQLELVSKLRSEIVWHRFFEVPAFICQFRAYIAVRKLLVYTSPNFSSRFCGCASFWQSPDILGKFKKLRNTPAD